MDEVYGYKAFFKTNDGKLKCRDHEFSLTELNVYDGEIWLCHKGFHFCPNLWDVFYYYNPGENVKYYRVRASGNIIEGRDKCVTDKLEILEECTDDEVYFAFVSQHGCDLEKVPEHFRTERICEKAVYKHAYNIKFVPLNLLTKSFCFKAIERDPRAVAFINDRTGEMIAHAFMCCKSEIIVFDIINKLTKEEIQHAIETHPEITKKFAFNHYRDYVPDTVWTNEFVENIFDEANFRTLEYIATLVISNSITLHPETRLKVAKKLIKLNVRDCPLEMAYDLLSWEDILTTTCKMEQRKNPFEIIPEYMMTKCKAQELLNNRYCMKNQSGFNYAKWGPRWCDLEKYELTDEQKFVEGMLMNDGKEYFNIPESKRQPWMLDIACKYHPRIIFEVDENEITFKHIEALFIADGGEYNLCKKLPWHVIQKHLTEEQFYKLVSSVYYHAED